MMDDPDISLDDLMKIIPAPDFPTGGLLLNTDEIRKAYETPIVFLTAYSGESDKVMASASLIVGMLNAFL